MKKLKRRLGVAPPDSEVRMARVEKRVLDAAARLPAPDFAAAAAARARTAGPGRRQTALAIAVGALACACLMIGWTLVSTLRQRKDALAAVRAEDQAVDAVARAADAQQERRFHAAQKLEETDPSSALAAYRVVARGRGRFAARAMYDIAKLEAANGRPDMGVASAEEYLRRFPSGAHAEAMAWMRAELFASTGYHQHAQAAARHYLEAYPQGVFAHAAQKVVDPHPR